MSIKGVGSGYAIWEKSQNKVRTSGNDFGKELLAAEDKSSEGISGDSSPENKLMSTEDIMKMISARKSEILEKVKKGETEPVIQIGAQAYTEKQWKRMLENFDDSEKDFTDKIKEALEEVRKKRMEGESE